MIKQKPALPMTPDQVAKHLAQLQAKGTPILAPSTKPLPQKHNKIRQFLIPILLVLGATITSIMLYEIGVDLLYLILIAIIVLFVWLTFRIRSLAWIGLQGKTLWDWLGVILVPIILAIYAMGLSAVQTSVMEQQNKIADEQLKSQVLQNYTSLIQDLILHEKLLESNSEDNVRTIARTQTDLAFKQLDKGRKAKLLLFISQLNLTDKSNPFIDLQKLDFSGADLSGTDLTGINLYGARLPGANFTNAYLFDSDLTEADLFGAVLREAYLSRANLTNANLYGVGLTGAYLNGANLTNANLTGANLTEADLTEADLTGAKVTDEQLKQVKSLQGAIMPDGSKHP